MELLDLLYDPGREFSPIPFWFLNGNLNHEEIRAQLRDFCSHGVYGVVLHPRIGLPKEIGYLSSDFFSYIRTAVEEADSLGMSVVLYDEGMYPSGSANGQVVNGHPELASLGLAMADVPLPGDEIVAHTEEGFLVARPSGGTIRGIHWGEDDGEPCAPPSADILNPEAVRRFIELTHEAYYRELGEYFGKTVIGFFTDEPCILGRNIQGMFPWTRGFASVLEKAGVDLAQLTALFHGEENQDTRLYQKMLSGREHEVYYRSLSGWCEAHGISLMGHPEQSDDIETERYFHIPGQDLVFRMVSPEKGGLDGVHASQAKCSADAARLFGRRRNSNECFGACNRDNNPWYLTGGDIKWFLDWLAVRGVNLFIPHAFYYSIEGKRKEERPPDVGPNSIWWPHYSQWSLYMRRLSCLMTDAELCVDTAVLCRNRDMHPELAAELFRNQIGFQYLPESMWGECRVENGFLLCRGHKYSVVLGSDDLFPGVTHEISAANPDCRLALPQPELRVAHIIRCGVECWFFVNEGEEDIRTEVELPTDKQIGQYDLWSGKACRFDGCLQLPCRGSLLLYAVSGADYDALPIKDSPVFLPAPDFTLVSEDIQPAKKRYQASIIVTEEMLNASSVILEIHAEEMADLSVNGRSAGVEFWSPQRFDLRPLLQTGRNLLQVEITGSPANRYGRPVPYGLIN